MVTILPSEPLAGEALFCKVTTDSDDADGDTATYTMSWSFDSTSYTGASTTAWTGDTVSGTDTVADQVWTCTATPSDGDDDGSTASDAAGVST